MVLCQGNASSMSLLLNKKKAGVNQFEQYSMRFIRCCLMSKPDLEEHNQDR
jgi:hypothetical protein